MNKQQFTYVLALVDTVAIVVLAFWLGYLSAKCLPGCQVQPIIFKTPGSPIAIHKEPLANQCLEVYGQVRGDLIPEFKIYLFETDSTEYSQVMAAVRNRIPTQSVETGPEKEFSFGCLAPGKYALAVPGFAYNKSIGYPLPLEIGIKNLSLKVAFQGGDLNYALAAFSIQEGPKTIPADTENLCFPLPAAYGRGLKSESI